MSGICSTHGGRLNVHNQLSPVNLKVRVVGKQMQMEGTIKMDLRVI
jgi:hypothetical protein